MSRQSATKKVFKIRLKIGDMVVVRSGKYKGKTGKISKVHPTLNAVTVDGLNIVKRHRKPTMANPQGGIVEITKPIAVSKLGYLDGVSKRPARIGYKIDAKNTKQRISKKTNKELK